MPWCSSLSGGMFTQVPHIVAVAFQVACVEPDQQPVLHSPKQQCLTAKITAPRYQCPLGFNDFTTKAANNPAIPPPTIAILINFEHFFQCELQSPINHKHDQV